MTMDSRRRKPDRDDDDEKRGSRDARQIVEAITSLEVAVDCRLAAVKLQLDDIIEALQRGQQSDPAILVRIDEKLDTIIEKETQMAGEMEALTQQVAETNGVIDSAIVLIQGLRDAIINAGTDPAKLAALTADLDAKEQELASAVGTPPTP